MYQREIFRSVLRHALEIKFGSKKITANQFANAYNLISPTPITNETARKWITGQGIPRFERIYELVHWLNINPMDLFPCNYLPRHDCLSYQRIEKKLDSGFNLNDIEQFAKEIKAIKYEPKTKQFLQVFFRLAQIEMLSETEIYVALKIKALLVQEKKRTFGLASLERSLPDLSQQRLNTIMNKLVQRKYLKIKQDQIILSKYFLNQVLYDEVVTD